MGNGIISGLKKMLDKNAPTVATFGSIVGVGLTIFFMHKAAKPAAAVEEKYEEKVKWIDDKVTDGEMKEDEAKQEKARAKMDKVLRLIHVYRWGLVSGTVSGLLSFLSNYLNGIQIAGLGTIIMMKQDEIKKGAEKLKEMLGEDKFKEFQENLEKDILGERLKNGNVKVEKSKKDKNDDTPIEDYVDFCVPYTGERYKAPYWLVDNAIKKFNKLFKEDNTAYLDYNTWRASIRIPSAPCWNGFVWTTENPFKARLGKVNYDDREMDAIIFDNRPLYEPSFSK